MLIRTASGTEIYSVANQANFRALKEKGDGWCVKAIGLLSPDVVIARGLTEEQAIALIAAIYSVLRSEATAFDAHGWLKEHKGRDGRC